METIVDPRDGLSKLMEINPRFPRQLWNRTELGINEPLMCIRIAQRNEVDTVGVFPTGVLFVSPIEDVQLLGLQLVDWVAYKFRTTVGGAAPVDPLSHPMPVMQQVRSFLWTYRSRQRKVFDPYFHYFFQDPVVAILWWLQFASWMMKARAEIGK